MRWNHFCNFLDLLPHQKSFLPFFIFQLLSSNNDHSHLDWHKWGYQWPIPRNRTSVKSSKNPFLVENKLYWDAVSDQIIQFQARRFVYKYSSETTPRHHARFLQVKNNSIPTFFHFIHCESFSHWFLHALHNLMVAASPSLLCRLQSPCRSEIYGFQSQDGLTFIILPIIWSILSLSCSSCTHILSPFISLAKPSSSFSSIGLSLHQGSSTTILFVSLSSIPSEPCSAATMTILTEYMDWNSVVSQISWAPLGGPWRIGGFWGTITPLLPFTAPSSDSSTPILVL